MASVGFFLTGQNFFEQRCRTVFSLHRSTPETLMSFPPISAENNIFLLSNGKLLPDPWSSGNNLFWPIAFVDSLLYLLCLMCLLCVASAISFALVRCVWCHLKLVSRRCPLNMRRLLCLLCMLSSVSEVSDMSDVISIWGVRCVCCVWFHLCLWCPPCLMSSASAPEGRRDTEYSWPPNIISAHFLLHRA